MAIAERLNPLAPSCTDHELVAAVRRGSDRAFEELYERYGERIRSYALGMVRDHGRAEDLTQDVFISALRRLHDTERPIAFKPWIYEIAKNACIDEFRRDRRVREIPLDSETSADSPPSRWLVPAADDALEAKQRLEDLRGAFHGLSESHHRMIVMREFEGLSAGQIAARMGISAPVVESTLTRARRRLSKEYDELVSGRRCEHVRTVIATDGERPLRRLGLRERRQLARHLSHCQPCRRVARAAAVDDSFFHAPGLAGKIAALFPFGWLRLRRDHRGHSMVHGATAHSASALRPLQSLGPLLDPSGASGLGRAAAALAAIVVAGAGGGVVAGLAGQGPGARHAPVSPQAVHPAAAHVLTPVRTPARLAHTSRARAAAASRRGGNSGPRASSGGSSRRTPADRLRAVGTGPVSSGASSGALISPSRTGSGGGGAAVTLGSGTVKLPQLPTVGSPRLPTSPAAIPNPLSLLASHSLPPLHLPSSTSSLTAASRLIPRLGHPSTGA